MRTVLSTLLIFLLFASVCATSFAQGKSSASDDAIYNSVKRKLANDPDVKGGAFDVDVKDGVVTIKGKVEKQRYKDKAERLVKKVHGVKKVNNELRIEPR